MENQYFVYVLLLKNGNRYVGQTNDLERRFKEHKEGKSTYTKKMGVSKLLYSEKHPNRSVAMKREKYLKSGIGRKWLKAKLSEHSA